MPKRYKELEKLALKAGFKLEKHKGKGSHRRFKHPDGRTVEIPMHPGEAKPGTEKSILKQIGGFND
ncbi:MAG: type II toxin-antitoxin system HicA family toxin [Lactobacillaceae bacterium]|jgi:predicted RNA binding protein YcfA (HicA-like mRNA interferase family)|nr:type II toxin-antitoxin system HicA family toxin [Lactobacillaceae bacterium]